MNSNKLAAPRSVQIAGSAVFGAMAAVLTVYLNFVYPLLGWLRFDFGEIPVIFAFLIFGPLAGLISSFVLWLTLNFIGTFVPVGPAMKLVAVLSTLLGLWIGTKLYRGLHGGGTVMRMLGVGLAFGLVTRVLLMTAANYVLIAYIAPQFLGVDYVAFAKRWISFATPYQGLLLILALTAIFNALHTLLSVIPSFYVARVVKPGGPIGQPWLLRQAQRQG